MTMTMTILVILAAMLIAALCFALTAVKRLVRDNKRQYNTIRALRAQLRKR